MCANTGTVAPFSRNLLLGGQGENDPVSRVVGTLTQIEQSIGNLASPSLEQLQAIIDGLRAVPVNVEIKVLPVEEARNGSELPVDIESDIEQEV